MPDCRFFLDTIKKKNEIASIWLFVLFVSWIIFDEGCFYLGEQGHAQLAVETVSRGVAPNEAV